ncbi:M23 family metallopeptidase [Insulibacter thermoxylanivorax]|nr:M23 family metallopeptidase [Insulibacter thermoxylanivorax]
MRKFQIRALLFLSGVMWFSMIQPANAAYSEYSEVFRGVIDSTTRWISPIADSNGNQLWPTVTSKWNEVRNVNGTSPHVGVDLSVQTSKRVVAVADGYLTNLGDRYNTVSLKTANDVYCHYEHMVVNTTGYPNGDYEEGDRIGTAGSTGSTGGEHLHFGAYDQNSTSGRKSYRTETLYRHASSWNYGRNLDTFSQAQWNSNKIARLTIVFSGAGNTHTELPQSVILYYRIVGSTAWIQGGSMQRNGSTYEYTFNFENVVPSGTNIQWMARITRNLSISYPYVWAPAKYYRPSSNPNSNSYPYAYFSNTVTY